ncbi:putative Early nodulin-like protein 22 [Hibiscus syriacus]|uniref:Early nodulin-like protein 22 n=1 Tax=Hibiscus syriacus TaxID=106335 RepID=A0A6A3BKU0_HIBSY|nr:putative Early nodulin-like protein 22 [Hibiscus syriacus]
MVFFMVFWLEYDVVHSYTPQHYIVGGEEGWDPVITMQGWAQGKDFHAGDVLEFIYDQKFDVAIVDKEGHDTCTVSDKSIQFFDGDDNITLAFGPNYFICSFPDICAIGLQLAINATAPPPSV